MIKKFKTIRSEIIFTYTTVFIGTLILLNILIYLQSAKMVVKLKKDMLYTAREFFLENLGELYDRGSAVSKQELLKEIQRVRLQNKELYIKISEDSGGSVGTLPYEKLPLEDKYGKISIIDGGREGNEYFYLVDRSTYDGRNYTFHYLMVTDYEEYFKILIKAMLIVEVLAILIAVFMGVKIADRVVKPINRISDMTESISADSLKERLPEFTETREITRLSELINNMLERLDRSFDNQKEFMSNVSHELRTPIAVIKGYVDLYKKVGPEDRELLEEAMEIIEEENENMKRMIEKLLFLAKNDIEEYTLNLQWSDVSGIYQKIKRDYDSIAGSGKVKVSVGVKGHLLCDQDLVVQMLRALIDNGIKYGDGGMVELGYYEDDTRSTMYVRDFGRGMTPGEVEDVFKRFYRGDKSRNRDSGSMGLGLSIVEKIAKIHRCIIEVESKPGNGSTFKVVFDKGDGIYAEDTDSRG